MSEEEIDISAIMVDPEPEEMEDNIAEADYEPGPDPYEIAAQQEAARREAERAAEEKYGQDRRRLILLIQIYLNEFPKQLEAFKKHKLEKMKREELIKLREEIEYVMSQKQNVATAVNGMIMGINVLEQLAVNFTPLKVNGTAAALAADEDAVSDMKCVAIKHLDMAFLEPESRLAMRVLTTAMKVHGMNTAIENQRAAAAPAPESNVALQSDPKYDSL
jgi:hypothetical protein